MLSRNFMDVSLRAASADFLMMVLLDASDEVMRAQLLRGLERQMEQDAEWWLARRALVFANLLQLWPFGGEQEDEEAGRVLRLCCGWLGKWPTDERVASVLAEKLETLESRALAESEVQRLLPAKAYQALLDESADNR